MVGTPTEESWSGVSRLPGLRGHVVRWGATPARSLGAAFPRLREAGRDAERLAAALLQPDPARRLPAARALHHSYFADLPPRLRELPDGMIPFHIISFENINRLILNLEFDIVQTYFVDEKQSR